MGFYRFSILGVLFILNLNEGARAECFWEKVRSAFRSEPSTYIPKSQALLDLEAYGVEHQAACSLVRKGAGYELLIREIKSEVSPGFFRLLHKALSEGALTQIDTGKIYGAKAFSILVKLQKLAEEKNINMTFVGSFRPSEVLKDAAETQWNGREKELFEASQKYFQFEKCAGGASSRLCRFKIDTKDGMSSLEVRQ